MILYCTAPTKEFKSIDLLNLPEQHDSTLMQRVQNPKGFPFTEQQFLEVLDSEECVEYLSNLDSVRAQYELEKLYEEFYGANAPT